LIGAILTAKIGSMGVTSLANSVEVNRAGLLIGISAAAALVLFMLVVRRIGQGILSRDPEGLGWRSVVGRVLAKTSLSFMILSAADVVTTYAGLPPKIARLIHYAFVIGFFLQGAVWVRELILGFIGRKVAEEQGAGTLGNAMAVIRVLISVVLFAVAGILILENLGVNVTALIAGLGIGGIAIGLAAQGIFSDLFAALSILFDKPFKKGDTIRYDQSTGTVERIGLKTTRLRAMTGEQLVMANTKLLDREIHNLTAAKGRRITLYLAISGEISTAVVDFVVAAAEHAVEGRKGCKLVRCTLSGAGGGGLMFDLVYDDATRDADKLANDRAEILRALIAELSERKLQLVRASDLPPAPIPL